MLKREIEQSLGERDKALKETHEMRFVKNLTRSRVFVLTLMFKNKLEKSLVAAPSFLIRTPNIRARVVGLITSSVKERIGMPQELHVLLIY